MREGQNKRVRMDPASLIEQLEMTTDECKESKFEVIKASKDFTQMLQDVHKDVSEHSQNGCKDNISTTLMPKVEDCIAFFKEWGVVPSAWQIFS